MNVRVTIDLPAEKLSELQALLVTEPVPVPEEPAVVAMPKSIEPERPRETPKNDKPKLVLVTKEMIRARGIEITKAGKQDQLAAVFKQFGAANLRSVKEEDYAAVYEMLEAI
jgi:hypothetical protein